MLEVQGRRVLSPACILEAGAAGVAHLAGGHRGDEAALVGASLGPLVDVGDSNLGAAVLEVSSVI